jgi:hypothetical protein
MENNSNQGSPPQVVIVKAQKSVGISILLTVLFGPLGMLYSTIVGGIVMLVISLIVAIFTVGFGLIITWPICVIWGAVAVNNANKKMGQ